MSLKLTITSYQRLSPGQETTKILDRGSISIGRAAQNDWILQDPERILSSKHCTVHHQDGGYFLTDTSTNGVYLNDADQRIGRNQKARLKDGDRFVLGEYEIGVILQPGADELEESPSDGPITDIVPFPGLMAGDSIIPGEPAGIASGDRDKPSFSDLLTDDQEASHLPLPGRSYPAGRVITEPPPDISAPDRAFFEPPELIPETVPPPFDLAPPVPKPEQRIEPVRPVAPPPLEIPELPAVAPPIIPEIIPAQPVDETPGAAQKAVIPDDWWLAPPTAPPAAIAATAPASPSPLSPAAPHAAAQAPEPPLPSATAPARPAAPPPRPPVVVAAPPKPPVESGDQDLLRAFLGGAGLPQVRLADDRLPETLANLGAIFRETVQGLAEILRARGDIKGEFRLDRTTLGPMENNPLKTPPGQPPLRIEEIMVLLLAPRQDAYMSPVQAVHEAFTDIKAHQVAVMAGIQAALNRLLERFDPDNLETRLQHSVFDTILPASRKAKYWDLFTSEYQTIAREAEDDFNELFGDEFARAYQERLRNR
ncbi:MAG: type VI secretion system-associated FHA domain protein TagH [Candidatus Contendobacter sp.]|jgi:type VI secretion system protein|nr:type VI secretion system-associated FHA domain protein TagH [Gammaproteobacteria bacterium]MCC8992190.1 type VI secretion system-associated FHA domain protein TagH [Candidatus Contendobacter sp.]